MLLKLIEHREDQHKVCGSIIGPWSCDVKTVSLQYNDSASFISTCGFAVFTNHDKDQKCGNHFKPK